MFADVLGLCPMGCGETLHLHRNGTVQCIARECPEPIAVTKLLRKQESVHHVVELTLNGFVIKHPLRERLEDDLFHCELHELLSNDQPGDRGRFLVRQDGPGCYSWELIG